MPRSTPRKSTARQPTPPQPTDAELDARARAWLERLLAEGDSASSSAASTPAGTPAGQGRRPR
jgi:hypothetical protein